MIYLPGPDRTAIKLPPAYMIEELAAQEVAACDAQYAAIYAPLPEEGSDEEC